MKIKLFLLLMLILTEILNVYSEEKTQLTIHSKDGTKVSYILRQQPKISFSTKEIIVKSNDVDIIYEREEIAKFTYEIVNVQTGIINLSTDEKAFEIIDNAIMFPQLKSNSVVNIYSISGNLIFHKEITEGGEYMFPLTSCVNGVYLVNVNGLTYKIILK